MDTVKKPQPRKIGYALDTLFEMPPAELSTLPEALIARLGISSWLVATFIISAGLYVLFLILAFFDGFIYQLNDPKNLWNSFTLPVLSAFLLLVQPLLRRLLMQTIDSYHDIIPFNNRLRRLELASYALKRRTEWLAVTIGICVGWFILKPPLDQNNLSVIIYDFVGDVLVFGLAGWHVFAALTRTKLLSAIHDQVQNLTVFKQSVAYAPIMRWSIANAAVIIAAIIISAVFIPARQLFTTTTMFVYGTLIFLSILIFVFGKVPTSALNQFRIFRALYMFLLVAIIGTIGFHNLEGWAVQDSLYATVITMTTIGYGDYSPVTREGQLFTIVLSLFAIGIGGYAVTTVASFVIDGQFHQFIKGRQVDKKIVRLRDHYILCGAGKLGRQLAIEFYKSQTPFVVIEVAPAVLEGLMREVEIPYVQGDATRDEVLWLAGIDRAKGLVTTLSNDKDNVFVTLTARSLNPRLHIISRLHAEKSRKKLEKAGADVIISPNAVSGQRMASEMLESEAVTLMDEMLRAEQQTGQTLRLEEVHVDEIKIPALVERLKQGRLQIADIGQRTELMVVAVKRGQVQAENGYDPYIYTPRGNTKLQSGDVLIVMGTPEQRIKLQQNVLSSANFVTRWIKL